MTSSAPAASKKKQIEEDQELSTVLIMEEIKK
jgi:hypothetical protein